jgi:hypothetical protein
MKPHIVRCDDESWSLEWIFRDERFGFNLEKDITESSWVAVSNSGLMACGLLPVKLAQAWRDVLDETSGQIVVDSSQDSIDYIGWRKAE